MLVGVNVLKTFVFMCGQLFISIIVASSRIDRYIKTHVTITADCLPMVIKAG